MSQIIQCVPNFSEGRNQSTINALVEIASSIQCVILADHSSDISHNRTVLTLLGNKIGIKTAILALAKCAKENIDMTLHKGEHPRIGAIDVIPLVPIKEITMQECVILSKDIGQSIASDLQIPVYLYEESATNSARRNLAKIRKGQFEGLSEKSIDFKPDYGNIPHPTAGAVALGARHPLIAFNANLSTSDIKIANKIAKKIRESNQGLKYCKAIGIMLYEKNMAQVSMNLVNYQVTSIYTAVESIRTHAQRYGVDIVSTELIGLSPAKALIDCALNYLQVKDFDYRQVLETHIGG